MFAGKFDFRSSRSWYFGLLVAVAMFLSSLVVFSADSSGVVTHELEDIPALAGPRDGWSG